VYTLIRRTTYPNFITVQQTVLPQLPTENLFTLPNRFGVPSHSCQVPLLRHTPKLPHICLNRYLITVPPIITPSFDSNDSFLPPPPPPKAIQFERDREPEAYRYRNLVPATSNLLEI
jgi:hypothetical protein